MSKIVLTKTSAPPAPGANQIAVYVTTGGDFAKIDEAGITTTLGAQGPTGPSGPAGTNGSTWYVASGAPSDTTGVDNDLYLNTATGSYYRKTSGTWGTEIGNLIGPQGPAGQNGTDGVDGTDGTNGTNGATWYSGSGVPSESTGVDGDFYLNTSTGDVYKKTSGTWNVVTNLIGPAGANGTNGQGVPVGGTTGQVLSKNSSTDYDTTWVNPPIANNAVRFFTSVDTPTANDDSSSNYRIGDIWIDSTAQHAYICISDAVGTALWKQITNV